MNAIAIKLWEEKQGLLPKKTSQRPKRQKRRRKRQITSESSDASIKCSKSRQVDHPPSNQTSTIDQTTSISQAYTELIKSSTSHSPALNISDPASLVVHISQRSGSDKRHYIAYQSTLSTQGTLPSVAEYPDSGLGESFSESDAPLPDTSVGIVPDSQSLPGSSSYVPTSTSGNSCCDRGTQSTVTSRELSSSVQYAQSRSEAPGDEVLQIDDSIDCSSLESALDEFPAESTQEPRPEPRQSPAATISSPSVTRSWRGRSISQAFIIAEDDVEEQHPSQATTTDDSVLSPGDPNSQSLRINRSQQSEEDDSNHEATTSKKVRITSSSTLGLLVIPDSAESREPPHPPPSSDEMPYNLSAALQAQRVSGTPPIIPSQAPYEVQEEPSRLHVEPLVLSPEGHRPVRNTHSVPHTPTTPSRLAMHEEVSPLRSLALKPIGTGAAEFIVPLAMNGRIMHQYVDTMRYYSGSVLKNSREKIIDQNTAEKISELLDRLSSVTTHIGLEGGGPGSQDEVDPEDEAQYAEISSEKFKFLGHLFNLLKDENMHIYLVAKTNGLADIVRTFLKGKKINHERSGGLEFQTESLNDSKLAVTLLTGEEYWYMTVDRKPDLIIALDWNFDVAETHIATVRAPAIGHDPITPVIRLVVYGSVEHIFCCLPRSLAPAPLNRLLTSLACAAQEVVGRIGESDLPTQAYAEKVAACLIAGDPGALSQLPPVRPIEDLPSTDSDSSWSDVTFEAEFEQLKSQNINRHDQRSEPIPSRVSNPDTSHQSSSKHPMVRLQITVRAGSGL